MLRLKLNHVIKKGPSWGFELYNLWWFQPIDHVRNIPFVPIGQFEAINGIALDLDKMLR